MDNATKEVTVDESVKGKTGFGLGQINNPTPKWANLIFRVFFYLASITTVIVTTDDEIPAITAKRIAKYLAFSVMAVHGLSKLTGVEINEDEFKKIG